MPFMSLNQHLSDHWKELETRNIWMLIITALNLMPETAITDCENLQPLLVHADTMHKCGRLSTKLLLHMSTQGIMLYNPQYHRYIYYQQKHGISLHHEHIRIWLNITTSTAVHTYT